jgi:S1-C subfamily serine protease
MRQCFIGAPTAAAPSRSAPGSEAQKSGLRDGDLFLSLNDVPFEKFNYRYYEYLERLGEPMQLKVRREGTDLTLIFPPTVVIP